MVQLQNKLHEIRELVDELYDNSEPHTSWQSMQFLKINQAIDEVNELYKRQIDCYEQLADEMEKCIPSGYTMGTDLDWDDLHQVEELMGTKYTRVNTNRRIY